MKELSSKGIQFDYVFLDPPFDSDYGQRSIEKLLSMGILAQDGMIIYEHSVDKPYMSIEGLEIVDERKYGTILITYLRRVL